MENYLWIFWTILGAILILAEVFTTGFVLLWFGLGALAAALANLAGVTSIPLQFLIFAVVSIGLTAASRTIRPPMRSSYGPTANGPKRPDASAISTLRPCVA